MSGPLTFPTLVTRQAKGSPLTNAEVDANFTGIQQYCLALANGLISSLTVGTDTGTLNSFAIISGMPISAYANGQVYFFNPANTNTGAATLNVNGLGPIPIYMNGQVLSAGVISTGNVYAVAYISGQFILISGSGTGSGAGGSSYSFTVNGTSVFTSNQYGLGVVQSNGAVTIPHGLGSLPATARVYCVKLATDGVTDTAVPVGAYVPVESFFIQDTTSLDVLTPAFTTAFDATNLYVSMSQSETLALPSIMLPTTGAGAQVIVLAGWAIVAVASVQTNVSSVAIPSLTYQISQPEGAFSYGNNLFVWQYGAALKQLNGTVIGLNSNVATALTAANTGMPLYQNHALFTRASGQVQSIFTSSAGLYTVPVVSPVVNIVPTGALYTSSGYYTLAVATGTPYVITANGDDTAYAFGATQTGAAVVGSGWSAISAGAVASGTSGYLYLKGTAGTAVTATVAVSGGAWAPTQAIVPGAWTGYALYNYKPVFCGPESGGVLIDVYVVASNPAAAVPINAVNMWMLSSAATPTAVSTAIDFTSLSILGNTGGLFRAQNLYVSTGAFPKLAFFQYNPFTQRIYLMTSDSNLLHIFQITNGSGFSTNILTWWEYAGRLGDLSYIKSIAIGAAGAWTTNSGTTSTSGQGSPNMCIEINQQTGLEVAIVIALSGNVTRVPWLE